MAAPAAFTLGQIAAALGATLEGDPTRVVRGVAPLDAAGPGEISFLIDPRYRAAAERSRAAAFLAPPGVTGLPAPVLVTASPRLALVDLIALFHPPAILRPGIAPSAIVAGDAHVAPGACIGALTVVEPGAVIGAGATLHPLVYVGAGAEIGEECVLYPHVVIREGVRLGRRVIVHAGAVIGADGFGYVFDGNRHRKIPHLGGVRIEDDVELGANTTIDRGGFGDTVIRQGTKVDNLVQIGHNVEIGEHSVLVAQVGIAGSCRIGRGVVLGGQAGIGDHVTVGDGASVGGQSGVHADIPAGDKVFGSPARPLTQSKRIFLVEGQLPDMARRLRRLERRVEALSARLGAGSVGEEATSDDA
ncbi:MAG: UDP-3-O-(3-hydroxymyristoyl)glucosamine N-acyltransferase [Candidatus Rokuibacteriota bacterium]